MRGASSEVQGDALPPSWDFDIIKFYMFNNLLNQPIKILKNKTKMCTVPTVLV
jgi:hypothetical protein